MKTELQGNPIELLPQKALWFTELYTLLIADLHLGKASHFRKAGIPVPNGVYDENIETLIKLLQWKRPERVIFLGDLFHSVHNREWNYFQAVIEQFPKVHFQLVLGNHDILDERHYSESGIEVINDELPFHGIRLTHEPLESLPEGEFNLYGHLHPGVRLLGKARQSLRLPCFHFSRQEGVLPAFGQFTGLALQKPKEGDRVYVVADEKVICVS